MSPIFGIFFMIGLIIGVRIVAWAMNSRPLPEPDCELHKWKKKNVNGENEDDGTYLVCEVCKQLPGGELEQFHVSKIR